MVFEERSLPVFSRLFTQRPPGVADLAPEGEQELEFRGGEYIRLRGIGGEYVCFCHWFVTRHLLPGVDGVLREPDRWRRNYYDTKGPLLPECQNEPSLYQPLLWRRHPAFETGHSHPKSQGILDGCPSKFPWQG